MAKRRTSDDENDYVQPEPAPELEPTPEPAPQASEPIGPYGDLGNGMGAFVLIDVNRENEIHQQLPVICMTGHKLITDDGEFLHVDETPEGQWRFAASR